MGKMVEKTRKKKKGRPSLLDLQKRTLKQEQEQQQQQQQQLNHHHNNRNLSALQSHNNYASATDAHLRRSTRRNPNPSPDKDDDEDESSGERRQKELKLVLKLPSEQKSPASCPNSHSSDWHPDDSSDTSTQKKRKINAIGCGSGAVNGEKGEKSGSGTKFTTDNSQEIQLDSRSSTPLPDKKLLLFILDRLQKKDTYGVFSEPVDPGELPDYHEVIEHPMDFGTVRKKLAGGAYANLEQFENDVFLIASNAMQYNAPETIYFRQARSIRELAQKNFENLRQDSDDNDPEPKVVRRGRPPTKSLKKPVGRPPLDRTGSEFSSDATLATGAESTTWPKHDMRKGHIASNKFGLLEPSTNSYFPRNDAYASWLAESKFDRSDEGSSLKGTVKFGKRYFVIDENRRNTYNQFHPSAATRELSVLSTFDGERRQLTPVGVYTEHGYARSLARFAANLGPIAWKIASRRIQMCVPSGTNFGPGWVGENDLPSKRSPLPILQSDELSRFWPAPASQNLHPAARSCSSEFKKDESHGRLTPSISSSDVSLSKPKDSFVPTSASAFAVNRSSEANTKDNSKGTVKPRPSSQIHQTPKAHPVINGFNSGYGFKVPCQMGKAVGATRPAGFDSQSSQMLQTAYMTSNNTVPVSRTWDSNNLSFSENSNSASPLAGPRGDPVPASWQQAQPHDENAGSKTSAAQNLESALPDLNVRFQQSRGSPSSSRVDSSQSDLVLHNELQ